jgi:hypothetical protein
MNTMFTDRLNFKELEETLANSTPLLALVGAGDLAVEKFKAAREEFVTRSVSFDPKTFREQAQASFTERVEALQAELQTAPEQLRTLPEKAQEWPARAQALFADIVSGAFSTYGELAGRGKTVVDTLRGEHAIVEHPEPVTRPTTARSTAKRTTSTSTTSSTAKKPAPRKTTAKKSTTAAKKTSGARRTTSKSTS